MIQVILLIIIVDPRIVQADLVAARLGKLLSRDTTSSWKTGGKG